MSTGSTAIEKNINENLQEKENEISFDEFSRQNPLGPTLAFWRLLLLLHGYFARLGFINKLYIYYSHKHSDYFLRNTSVKCEILTKKSLHSIENIFC